MPQPHIHKNISNSIRRVIHDTRNLSDNPTYGISKRLLASALAIVAGSAVAVGCASAEGSVEFSLTVPDTPVLEVVIQGTDAEGDINLSMAPTMAKADFNTADVAVTVGTSSTAGYNLKMAVGNSGQLVSGGNSIPSLAAAEDENGDPYSCTKATKLTCNFTVNSWGYWMTGDVANNYRPIPSAETELANYTTGATNGVTTELEFGVRVNAKQAGGDYQTTINFIATANPELMDDISKVKTMQDFATLSSEERTAVLGTMVENQSYPLRDNRDNNIYNIAKLIDGNVWLMDNLALDLVNVPLTDLQGNTNASNETLAKLKNGGGSSPYTTAAVVETSSFGETYNAAKINSSYGSYNKNSEWLYDGTNKGKQGIYYNYCAASAGSYCYAANTPSSDPDTSTIIDAKEDICPAGWRMPTGGANGEYRNLCTTAWGSACSNNMNMSYSDAKSIQSVLHAPLSGSFYGTSTSSQGSGGFFWSSTYYNGNDMYRLNVGNSKSWAQGNRSRDNGNSVRCVLKAN